MHHRFLASRVVRVLQSIPAHSGWRWLTHHHSQQSLMYMSLGGSWSIKCFSWRAMCCYFTHDRCKTVVKQYSTLQLATLRLMSLLGAVATRLTWQKHNVVCPFKCRETESSQSPGEFYLLFLKAWYGLFTRLLNRINPKDLANIPLGRSGSKLQRALYGHIQGMPSFCYFYGFFFTNTD